jgi:very-short-patch-repair endonuclease
VHRWYGARVTSVERTVVDIARGDRDAGLVVADAALYEGLTSVERLRAAVALSAGWPGNAAARWVLRHADGRSESPLESLTRSALLVAGLPAPDLQVWIPEARARVDLLYRAQRLVVEADGLLTYTSPADLRAEKYRQERLERAGYRVVRVLWADVRDDPSGTAARIRAALGRP